MVVFIKQEVPMKSIVRIVAAVLPGIVLVSSVLAAEAPSRAACRLPQKFSGSKFSAKQYEAIARAAGAKDCEEVMDPDRLAERAAKALAHDSLKARIVVPEPGVAPGTVAAGNNHDSVRCVAGPKRRATMD